MIQYSLKSRDFARDVFDETIVDIGGVRFFIKYEKCSQIETHGPKKITEEVLIVRNQKIGQKSRGKLFSWTFCS